MRFHCIGVPHTVTNKEFSACAYTQKVLKFCKMMKDRGHHTIHYGHEDSNLECGEHVSVLTKQDWEVSYGEHNYKKKFFTHSQEDYTYQVFYKNTIPEIKKRLHYNDFVLPFWGLGVKPICDAVEKFTTIVEPGIGYAHGMWANYKVFESYAIYHAYSGADSVAYCNYNMFDVVIPNYFDLSDFEYNKEKEDYFLYVGRVYTGKGVHIAVEACKKMGVRLVVAGQMGDDYELPKEVDYVGYVNPEQRSDLMKNARAVFTPSQYIEPFCGVMVESLLCGTPVISSDIGAFVENNIHGITGYRCRTIDDYCEAISNIHLIKNEDCRRWGENFSLENIGPKYEKYFNDILNYIS